MRKKLRTKASCNTHRQQYFSYLLLKFDQTYYSVSALWGIDAREIIFRFVPIWLPSIHKRVSTNSENADLKTCRQRFCQVIFPEFDQTCYNVSTL